MTAVTAETIGRADRARCRISGRDDNPVITGDAAAVEAVASCRMDF